MSVVKIVFAVLLLSFSCFIYAQDNSPYSRYGLGDLMPSTNITTRGMGSIAAGYTDVLSINFSNPASYSQFQTILEQRSKKLQSGRVTFDVGLNFDNRTLIAPNTPGKFTSSDALFSYMQIGLPLRKNWGLTFGLRPMTRIGYSINRDAVLKDPVSNNNIERAITQFKGSGGSYLPTIGTGFGFNPTTKSLISAGFNLGYFLETGKSTTLRTLINDTVPFYSSEHTTSSNFGDLFVNAGLQYQTEVKANTILRIGVSGNWEQKLNAQQDVLRQTFTLGSSGEQLQIDSVFQQRDVKGQIIFPATYKFGFVLQQDKNAKGWLIGADYSIGKWNDYRYFGNIDSTQNNWMINVGGQFYPRQRANYFSRLTYRFGFYTGNDYVKVGNKLPQFGGSFGLGIPVRPSRTSLQFSRINLALEYGKRGNNDNRLKENIFRASVGLNLTDLWFGKRRYD